MSKVPYQSLFYAVGRGLSSWSVVEMNLASVFHALSGTYSHELFGAVNNFETRLAMCDKLISLSNLSEFEKAMWGKLSVRLSRFYKKRHEIAHFTVGKSATGKDVILPFRTTATFGDKNQKELQAEQINERIAKFWELSAALDWFSTIIPRRRMPKQEPFLKPLEEPHLVVRIRELVDQNPPAPSRPPQ